MPATLIEIKNLTVKRGDTEVLRHLYLSIRQHEQWAIVGHSGSGKSTLALALIGSIFYQGDIIKNNVSIVLVEQQHHFKTLANTHDFYYQQRFNSFDAEDAITVETALASFSGKEKWVDLLQLTPLLSKPLIQLSNGENKRLQLVKALCLHPQILILDNPFIGLDVEGRETLHQIFNTLTRESIHILLITSSNELPSCITHVAVLENGSITWKGEKETYKKSHPTAIVSHNAIFPAISKLPQPEPASFTYAVRMKDVNVQYGDKKILQHINWEVKKGECWNLSGPNGAGKSTLLSLISADNPQAYANEIYLFDKRRGSGESIWEIKKQIGYVSPELHLFFEQHNTCTEVIASGLFDTVGLFRQLHPAQEAIVNTWIELLSLQKFRHRSMFQLSNSQQRMVLLARALIKHPPLLILDEPCQGLDELQTDYFTRLVNEVCTQSATTLIYVSHYAKDIPACVNHFLRLEDGCIKQLQ